MYVPGPFEESRPEVLRELVRAHPFATLVTWTAGLAAESPAGPPELAVAMRRMLDDEPI